MKIVDSTSVSQIGPIISRAAVSSRSCQPLTANAEKCFIDWIRYVLLASPLSNCTDWSYLRYIRWIYDFPQYPLWYPHQKWHLSVCTIILQELLRIVVPEKPARISLTMPSYLSARRPRLANSNLRPPLPYSVRRFARPVGVAVGWADPGVAARGLWQLDPAVQAHLVGPLLGRGSQAQVPSGSSLLSRPRPGYPQTAGTTSSGKLNSTAFIFKCLR